MSRKEKDIELTESERLTLREGSKHHPKTEFREKCQGLLLNYSGMSFKKIATYLDVNHNTVGNWVNAWETFGLVGLTCRSGQGRKLILNTTNTTHTQLIDKAVEAHSQNVKAIQAELVKELNTSMSSDTVKRF
ncbi:helix-turn-helix domain-containing protein [Spirosoma sp. HMF4905]|uniref:Helix-turn-helix domain-containing protein n=1 Tax=Spirosoma arboris TaxID=2682092 RepID=A0A7K1S5P9_9BACT|nr:helix-turn-helix domain-containing protein [Spirosoma arboris]MVM29152.1 helix-turn-helix domain-containing protein [Spirosoma arboris]